MGKLFFASILISLFYLSAFCQNVQTSCPEISIETSQGESGGYWNKNSVAFVSVNYASGNFKDADWKYSWRIKNNNNEKFLPSEIEKDGYTSFATTDELDGETFTATVEISGLPVNCQNIFSKTFRILYNPGTPLIADEYEEISFAEEKIRLDKAVTQLKEIILQQKKKYTLVFIFSTKNYDDPALTKRRNRISGYLIRDKKLSKENFNFVYGGAYRDTNLTITKIYIIRDSGNIS